MILADKIIELRKKNGWSQEELAEKLGVSRQAVSKWEGAQSVPDIQRILEMSRLFSVSTDYLLKDDMDYGSEALAAVKEQAPGYYHFILMDLEMPVMGGFEATMRIRSLPNRIRANTPIIALTANAVPETRERAAAVGMDDFLVKPANSARLLRSLAKLL